MNTTPQATQDAAFRVIDAYYTLVNDVSAWVGLRRLREHLADIDQATVNAALTDLFKKDIISLISEANRKSLTDADRAATLLLAGDEKHLYRVD